MSVEQPLLMMPYVPSSTGGYNLVVSVTGGGAGPNTCAFASMTAARNYWPSADGQADSSSGNGDMLTMLATCIVAHANITACTVSLTSTMKVLLTPTFSAGTQMQLLWTSGSTTLDAIAEWFGFSASADSSTGATVTSPNVPKGLWWPERPIAQDSRDIQPILGATSLAASGLARTSRVATPYKQRDISFRLLEARKVLSEYTDSDEPYIDLEYFWVNGLARGRKIRLYEDDTALSSSDYTYYYNRAPDLETPFRRSGAYRIRWDADLSLVRSSA